MVYIKIVNVLILLVLCPAYPPFSFIYFAVVEIFPFVFLSNPHDIGD